MRTSMLAASLILSTALATAGQTGRTTLDIYVVDVEAVSYTHLTLPTIYSV